MESERPLPELRIGTRAVSISRVVRLRDGVISVLHRCRDTAAPHIARRNQSLLRRRHVDTRIDIHLPLGCHRRACAVLDGLLGSLIVIRPVHVLVIRKDIVPCAFVESEVRIRASVLRCRWHELHALWTCRGLPCVVRRYRRASHRTKYIARILRPDFRQGRREHRCQHRATYRPQNARNKPCDIRIARQLITIDALGVRRTDDRVSRMIYIRSHCLSRADLAQTHRHKPCHLHLLRPVRITYQRSALRQCQRKDIAIVIDRHVRISKPVHRQQVVMNGTRRRDGIRQPVIHRHPHLREDLREQGWVGLRLRTWARSWPRRSFLRPE